jgi:hypothetical protein
MDIIFPTLQGSVLKKHVISTRDGIDLGEIYIILIKGNKRFLCSCCLKFKA